MAQRNKKSTNADPLISIITVVFNAEKSIEQTIQSVINQVYKKIEFIIIDGGSTDNTLNIIRKYQDHIHYWVSEPDAGIYDAMNKAINIATGDWYYFLGAGDLLFNRLHNIALNFTEGNTIYYGNVYKLDESTVYDGNFSGFKLAVKNICHQAIFYPDIVFKKYKYNLKYRIQADHDLNMRCYGDNALKFKYLPFIIAVYEGDGLSSFEPDIVFFKDKLGIIKSNFPILIYQYAYCRNKLGKLFNRSHLKMNNNKVE